MSRQFFVYIMSSFHRTLYIGMTNNLLRRVMEHKKSRVPGFTSKYKCFSLVYYEQHGYPHEAIAREKQLKRWNRNKKIVLVKSLNCDWVDLAKDWKEEDI